MPITATYDPEARAIYVRLGTTPVARSVEIDEHAVVDTDSRGVAVGLELLAPPVTHQQIVALAECFDFLGQLDSVWRAVRGCQPAEPRRSGVLITSMVEFPGRIGSVGRAASSASRSGIERHDFALSA